MKMSIVMNFPDFPFCVYIFQILATVQPEWGCVCVKVCVSGRLGSWLPAEIVESPWAIPCPSVASATRSGKRDSKIKKDTFFKNSNHPIFAAKVLYSKRNLIWPKQFATIGDKGGEK